MVQLSSRHAALKELKPLCTAIVYIPKDKEHLEIIPFFTLESSSKYALCISSTAGPERNSLALNVLCYGQKQSSSIGSYKSFTLDHAIHNVGDDESSENNHSGNENKNLKDISVSPDKGSFKRKTSRINIL